VHFKHGRTSGSKADEVLERGLGCEKRNFVKQHAMQLGILEPTEF
jgi:hypothetical protein